jgi:hypothetical protein
MLVITDGSATWAGLVMAQQAVNSIKLIAAVIKDSFHHMVSIVIMMEYGPRIISTPMHGLVRHRPDEVNYIITGFKLEPVLRYRRCHFFMNLSVLLLYSL